MSKKYYEAFTIYNKQIELVGLSFIISEHSFVIEYASHIMNTDIS